MSHTSPPTDDAHPYPLASDVLLSRLYCSLVEARAWVEHSVAPLRPLSAAAAEPGEKLLRQIDVDLVQAQMRLGFGVNAAAASDRLNDVLAAVREAMSDDALVGGRS